MSKIILKSLLTALDIAAVVMLIICAVYYWTIPGFILLGLAAVQYIAQTIAFIARHGLFGLASLAALLVLGFAIAFPVIIVGMGMTVIEALFIVGAIAALLSAAYTFAVIK